MYIFDRSWPNLWELIKEVSSHIWRLTRLMRTEISLEHIRQEHEFRKTALEQFRKQASETRRQEFDRIKTSLRPREYNESLYELRAERSGGTGNWLFSSKAFIEWFDDSHGESRILWLKGIPGAGKRTSPVPLTHHPVESSRQDPGEVRLRWYSERANIRAAYHQARRSWLPLLSIISNLSKV